MCVISLNHFEKQRIQPLTCGHISKLHKKPVIAYKKNQKAIYHCNSTSIKSSITSFII